MSTTTRIATLETLFTADVKPYERDAAKVEASQKAIAKSDPRVKVKADAATALKDMTKVENEAEVINKKKIIAKVEAQTAKARQAMTELGQVGVAMGAAIGAGVGVAVAKFSEFDTSMSHAQAATMATGKALKDLRAAAIEQGALTMYSASEAADAITAEGKAGLSTADILGGGLTAALALAASGEVAVGRAGEIAATAMTQFGLTGKDLPHVTDLIAAGAGKAQGGVEDMANAMKYVGPVAKNLNVSIEETTGTIAELASQGIIGEQAGTSLRGMLLSLTSPSMIATKTMDELGISVYDAQGKFIGLDGVAEVMRQRLGKLDDATRNEAFGRIFGNAQITAATILYNGGAKAVNDWTNKVNDSGYAARQAAMLTDNLSGDLERLGSSLDTALIQTGSGANEVLRKMAQDAEGVVNILGAMNPAALTAGLAVLAVLSAVGLLGGGLLLLVPKIAATKVALDTLSKSHKTTASVIKGVGIAAGAAAAALTIGTVVLGTLAARAADAQAKTDALVETLDKTTGAITSMTRESVKANLAQKQTFLIWENGDSAFNNAKKLGISLELVTDAALGNATALEKVNAAIHVGYIGTPAYDAALKKSGLTAEEYNNATSQLSDSLKGSNKTLDDAVKIAQQKAAADKGAAKEADTLTTAVDFTSKAIDGQVLSMKDLLDAQNAAAGVNITAAQAEAAWAQQTLDATDAIKQLKGYTDDAGKTVKGLGTAVKDGGASLDLYTEAGQLASKTLLDTADAAWKLLNASQAEGASSDELKQKTADARDEFLKVAGQMGLTADAASALADKYGLIPSQIQTTAELVKAQAEADLDALANKVKSLPNGIISVDVVGFGQVYSYLTQTQDLLSKINGTRTRIALGAGSQGGTTFADGGTIQAANGLDRQSMIAPGGANILWAEPSTGWETYISGKPSQRERNIGLLKETATRFGLTVLDPGKTARRADGGSSGTPAASGLSGMAITGTLDLGNGLIGMLRGVVRSEMSTAQAARTSVMSRGTR